MTAEGIALPVVAVPGLASDSLGNYLASLGLLRLLARKWPSVRIAWRDEILQTVGGPARLDELLDELISVAERHAWTPYARNWAEAQKKSSVLSSNKKTSAQSGLPFAEWQAGAKEDILELFSAHVVPHAAGRSFNPLLGSGGNAGKRSFPAGWERATNALSGSGSNAQEKNGKKRKRKAAKKNSAGEEEDNDRRRPELESWLLGRPTGWLIEKLNAASWFSDANKVYNSGQRPYREEPLSPWAMALACEGLAFLAGGASRRLGARARAKAAFPFITHAAAPAAEGEAGHDLAEFWAPLWERPMTVPEVRTLFSRGRAEVRGRGVLSPGAFATAIVRRGVDAGIAEFRRFVLERTTSANTFEPRFAGAFRLTVPTSAQRLSPPPLAIPLAAALERILGLIERLPNDPIEKGRQRFVGLRGPVERGLLHLAAAPEDPDAARALLDAVVAALDRVDRNRDFREKHASWQPLPFEWLPSFFSDGASGIEARLALALVSGFPASRPLTLYRFGVEWKYGRFEHPERPPARWTWRPGALPHVLSAVLLRRTLDWELERTGRGNSEVPVHVPMAASCGNVSRWLDGLLDEDLLGRWISRLALFDLRSVPHEARGLASPLPPPATVDGALVLFGMLQPLFDLRPVTRHGDRAGHDLLDPKTSARTPAVARALANLIRIGQVDAAVRLASSRFAMARAPLARTSTAWQIADSERLLASLLFTIPDEERSLLIERWLRPQRQKEETIHV